MEKVKVAIVGPGNIGIDLMKKIIARSNLMELVYVAGIYKDSLGLKMAAEKGIQTSYTGLDEMLEDDSVKIVFDATSAKAHIQNAPLFKKYNKIAIDLTPAAVGPYVIPVVNIQDCLKEKNVNLVTCGGQATIPIVQAVSRVQPVLYGEIVSTIASQSAGPGTRRNIDEFTETTANAIEMLGGAKKGKTIIILNPADPPILMRNTIYTQVENPDMEAITDSVKQRVEEIKQYVPGYELVMPPSWDGQKVTTMIQVTGAGDYLPTYAGNLDIITCAAVHVGDKFAKEIIEGRIA